MFKYSPCDRPRGLSSLAPRHPFLVIQGSPPVSNNIEIRSSFQQESNHWIFSAESRVLTLRETFGEFCQFEKNTSKVSRMPILKHNPPKLEEWEIKFQERMEKYVDQQNQDWLELRLQKQHHQLIHNQRHVVLSQQQIQEQQTELELFEDPLWEKELQEQIESLFCSEHQQDCLDELEVREHLLLDQSHRTHHIQLEQQRDFCPTDWSQTDRELLEANLVNGIETQNDQMLTQMVENQHQFTKTILLKGCELEVSNELRNDLVNLSEYNPHFMNGKASMSTYPRNIGRSATVNFHQGFGESGFGGQDGGSGRDNWGGSRGGNSNNGDDDFLHPGVRVALYSLLFFVVIDFFNKILHWISKRFQEALEDLQKYLNTLLNKNPQNIQTRLYSLFLKFLYGFIALLTGPEAFEIALRTLGNPLFRVLFRVLRFCSRCALMISLFLGGSFYGLHWYKMLMSIVGPTLDQTMNF
uniref:Uncharacterized protein n=1 Tax=Rhipilia penicilloides TaxID=1979422 RepID=A0A2P0QHM6_9CHLO|nr:hypothetical protein [Rhipilia penicilloides]ARO74256.1 hypothetical protein [Rhipilia penicilloides]